jgi:NIMA (never in mitosis gene a)-related kinase
VQSDVWALGCVLYELTTLRHAFDGGNMCALVLKILRGKYPPIDGSYSVELRDLVSRMLQSDVRRDRCIVC